MMRDVATTLRSRRLGRQLQKRREATGLDRQQVADRMGVSLSAVTQWENGHRNIRVRDLKQLLELYQVPAEEHAPLLELAAATRETTWWAGSLVHNSFLSFLSLETEAAQVEEYSSTLVPGLAQTQRYARAVLEAGFSELDEETINSRLAVRMRRAELLEGTPPLRLHIVLDEGVIRRQVGGAEVWHEQLDHLIALTQRRSITLQVLPYSVGAHASMLGGFTILTFADKSDSPTVYEERLTGDIFTEGIKVRTFRLLFDALRTSALPPELSVELIQQVANGK